MFSKKNQAYETMSQLGEISILFGGHIILVTGQGYILLIQNEEEETAFCRFVLISLAKNRPKLSFHCNWNYLAPQYARMLTKVAYEI